MAKPKMLILRGNSAPAGSYPDEKGNANVAWPIGALHVPAASDYASMRGYEAKVLHQPGQPQSEHSPQANAALKEFLDDDTVTAFYGFSGGDFLAKNKPETLNRITLVVVIGSPNKFGGKAIYLPSVFNSMARRKDANWEVVFRTNPVQSQMPKHLKNVSTHMFGPDILVTGWPEGVGT
jgi:hypothetical protein